MAASQSDPARPEPVRVLGTDGTACCGRLLVSALGILFRRRRAQADQGAAGAQSMATSRDLWETCNVPFRRQFI